MSCTASHAKAAAWVLAVTLLFGWAVAGCDRDEDIVACVQKCKAGGGERKFQQDEWFSTRATACICSFPMPFADAGTR